MHTHPVKKSWPAPDKPDRFALLQEAMSRFPERKLFCPLPFKHLEIMAKGRTLLCCYIKKSPGTLQDGNLAALYNSPAAREVRRSILDGTFRYCDLEACPHFAAGSLPLQADCGGTRYEKIIADQSTFLDEINVWLSFDQRCNLHCITCRPEPFRCTDKEKREMESLLLQVKADLARISNLGLCGSGDPFASPLLRSFLEDLDASRYPALKVSLLTNGILLNRKAWESIRKATPAIRSIQVSVDAASRETYEKIRRGGSYETIQKNLRFLSRLRADGAIGEFILSFVVSAWNYREMADFVGLGLKLGCDQIYFSGMMDWGIWPEGKYGQMAVHQAAHEQHSDFREMLRNPLFDHAAVCLGNLHRFKPNRLLRDSLFS